VTDTDTGNVIPEQEINRRRRVNELADECASIIADLMHDFDDTVKDLRERTTEVAELTDIDEFITEIIRRCPEDRREILTTLANSPWVVHLGLKSVDQMHGTLVARHVSDFSGHPGLTRRQRMRNTIDRLLKEATQTVDDPPERVIPECQIILRSGFKGIGVLRKTPEGMLSFMATAQASRERVLTVEHFFDYDDLETIILIRHEINAPEPKSPLFGAT
jgi:hypothetical protein